MIRESNRRPWLKPLVMALLTASALVFASGCESGGPPTYPVIGHVTFRDGAPVTSGVIEFEPADGGPSARGRLAPNGHFVLKTGDKAGAVAGRHRIVIVQMLAGDQLAKHDVKVHVKPRFVNRKHSKFAESGLEEVVKSDGKNDFAIQVDAE